WPRNRLVAPPLKASMLCSQTASLPPPPAASQISSIYCEYLVSLMSNSIRCIN
uniref:Uncharacterized protein n=1 Tax=Aegilops tauschii subsp. strangulata TaxID=200361 RepID=A0A453QFJ8_AEGTS